MKLNRNNYEEYFILYLDNELSSEARREVEIFAQENPDLKAELDLLMQSKISPDTDITFTDKESLMVRDSSSINMNNYEEWLLSYIDDELTSTERKGVERFVAEHPAVNTELNVLQQTKLQPEAIIFPDKESLYRKEEKVRVVAIRWWKIAAAAILLIGISTTAVVLLNKKPVEIKTDTAKTWQPKIETSTGNDQVKPSENVPLPNQESIAGNNEEKVDPLIKEPVNDKTIAIRKNITTSKEKTEQPQPVKEEEPVVAQTNNLPKPDFNPNVTGSQDQRKTEVIAEANTLPSKEILTNIPEKTGIGAVTAATLEPSDQLEQPAGKKNKLRGFFRKITRTFEKNTNIKATDGDDDRLLIAGLSIKLN